MNKVDMNESAVNWVRNGRINKNYTTRFVKLLSDMGRN